MATQKEQAQIDVIINGQKANATINDMEKAVKTLNLQIKNLEPGTEAFIKKSEDLKKVTKNLKDTKQSVSGVSDETKNMLGQMAKIGPGGNVISMLTGGFKSLTGGVGQAVKGLFTLNGALLGSGFGAILFIFGALITYFKNTEEGGDRLAKIMRVVEAIFGEVIKVVSKLGGWLFDAADAMVEFVAGSDQATKSTDDYKKSVTQLSSEIADLEDHVSALSISIERQNDKLQTGIQTNLKALKNGNITLEESRSIIKKVSEDENKRLANSNKLINEKIAIERKQFLLSTEQTKEKGDLFDKFINDEIDAEEILNKAKGTFKEEDLKRIAEILKDREAATREAENLGEKLNNLEDAAVNKDIARREKQAAEIKRLRDKKQKEEDDARKKEEDILKNIYKLQQDALTDSIEDSRKKLNDQAEEEIKKLVGTAEQIALQKQLIETKLTNDLKKINDAHDADVRKKAEEEAKKLSEIRKKSEIASSDYDLLINKNNADLLLQAKIDRINIEKIHKLDSENITAQEVKLINAKSDQDIADLEEQFRKQKLDKIKEKATEVAGYTIQGIQDIEAFSKIKNDNEVAAIQKTKDTELQKNEKTKADALAKLDLELAEKRIKQEDYNKKKKDVEDIYDKQKSESEKAADAQTRAIKNKQAQGDKRAKVLEGIASVALAVIKALPNVFLAAAAGVTGGINLAKIIATPAATFSKGGAIRSEIKRMFNFGGITKGSRHGSSYGAGGIAMIDRLSGMETGELQGNEIILTEGVTNNPRLRAEASRINVAGGGRSFALGGTQGTDTSSDSSTVRSSETQSINIVNALNKINETLAGLDIKAHVVYNEIEDAEKIKNDIISETKLTL